MNLVKIDEIRDAEKAATEAYNSYDEGEAEAPQRSSSRFLPIHRQNIDKKPSNDGFIVCGVMWGLNTSKLAML